MARYIESPYFRFTINPGELTPGQEKLLDFRDKTDQRYLPFNYLIVKNISSIDIEILIDDNKKSDWLIIPAGTIITIDNEVFTKLRIKNVDVTANDKKIYIEAKREVKEKDLLKSILNVLGGKVTLNY